MTYRWMLLCLCLLLTTPTLAQDPVSNLLGRINQLRAEQDLPPYALNGSLTVAARNHAQWMADSMQVSHVQPDGSSPSDRAAAAGYASNWVSENIYMGLNANVNTAWQFWVNSPIHYNGLVSPNFRDIGIASATGEGGRSYVLVFGNPGGSVRVPASASGDNAASNAAPAPPPYLKGVDDQGNLLHEIQPGHTMGDIALIYGYTWDDIPQILDLNEMTDADFRSLEVGQIVRVPPKTGTYTPTPASESTAEATAPATDSPAETTRDPAAPDTAATATLLPASATPLAPATTTANSTADPAGILPTPTATLNDQPPGLPGSQATTASTAIPTTVPTQNAAAQMPSPTSQQIASNPTQNTLPSVTPLPATALPAAPTSPAPPSQSPPMWLLIAVGIQLFVLGFASAEYLRRRE